MLAHELPGGWLKGRRWRIGIVATMLVAVVLLCWWLWASPAPHAAQHVFPGIAYICESFNESEIRGLAHIVIVDLAEPGLRLYVTPLDRQAAQSGWEYYTCWPPTVAYQQDLAVAINATLFQTNAARWAIWPGVLARSTETVVADHEVNHLDAHSYLLWFEDDLTPHLEKSKPPSAEVCRKAAWGISGQGVMIDDGCVSNFNNHIVDARTFVGIDREKKLLFLAVFEGASEDRAARVLVGYGVKDAIALDGGDSTCLAFGRGARDLRRSTIVYPHGCVATVFGVGFQGAR